MFWRPPAGLIKTLQSLGRPSKTPRSSLISKERFLVCSAAGLSGPISRDIAILSLRYHILRDTFSGRFAAPQNGAIPPPWYLVSHRHICAIPHFATYLAIIVRYPIKISMKEFCDAVATSIAQYEEYRCWASKLLANTELSQIALYSGCFSSASCLSSPCF